MKHTRYLAAAFFVLGLAACGGAPTASDPDVAPRFDAGGGFTGSGSRTGGGVMSTDANDPPPPPPGDSTNVIGGGWIGSGS